MNNEALDKFLKSFTVPETMKNFLLGEEVPEGYDFDKDLQSKVSERESFFVDKNKKTIIDEYEAKVKESRYLDTVNPIRNKIIKDWGLTKEETDGLDAKQLSELARAKHLEEISNVGSKTNKEVQSELEEYQKKYLAEKQEREKMALDFEARINSAEAKAEQGRRNYIIKDKFSRLVNSGVVDFSVNNSVATDLLNIKIKEFGYDLALNDDLKLEVVSLKGGIPVTLDGNGKYESPTELINDISNRIGIVKRSNGGEQNTPKGSIKVGEKTFDRSVMDWFDKAVA